MIFQRNKTASNPYNGSVTMAGTLSMVKKEGVHIPTENGDVTLSEIKEFALPHNGLSAEMIAWKYANMENIKRGLDNILISKQNNLPTFWGTLEAKKIRADGDEIDYGIISLRVVTDAGVAAIAAQLAVTAVTFKFHALGTGTNAEASGDTALQTELTTQYNPDNTRATGSQSSASGTGSATYTTAGTNTVDAGAAITEHGVMSQAANSGGTLLDRSKFSVITLSASDGLLTTYTLTLNSGG